MKYFRHYEDEAGDPSDSGEMEMLVVLERQLTVIEWHHDSEEVVMFLGQDQFLSTKTADLPMMWKNALDLLEIGEKMPVFWEVGNADETGYVGSWIERTK